MDGLFAKIQDSYDVDVKNIKKTKGYYAFNSLGHAYVLRKTQDNANRFEFRMRLQKNLLANGFANIEKIYPTKEKGPFMLHEEQKYILTDSISGDEVNFDDKMILSKAFQALKDFHKSSEGLKVVPDEFYSEHMGIKLRKMAKDISMLRKRVNFSKGLSDFDLIFLKNYEFYERNIVKAIEILSKTNYHEKLKLVHNKNPVCHNLLKKETIVIVEGEVYLSSLSSCLVDHFSSDIAMFINKYMKYDIKRPISIMEIIDMYSDSGHNKLDICDYRIILSKLLMPAGFLNAAGQYYIKKRSWVPSAVTGDLEYEINSREAFCDYIEPLLSMCT